MKTNIPENVIGVFEMIRGDVNVSVDYNPAAGLVYLRGDWGDPDSGEPRVLPVSGLAEASVMVLRKAFAEAVELVDACERQYQSEHAYV